MRKSDRQQAVIHRAVRRTLRELEGAGGNLVQADGESYVCRYCVQPIRPCKSDPHFECRDKILGETSLKRLVTRVHEASKGLAATCAICGKTLRVRDMRRNALRELCPSCEAKSARTKRGKTDKGKIQ